MDNLIKMSLNQEEVNVLPERHGHIEEIRIINGETIVVGGFQDLQNINLFGTSLRR